MGLTTPEGYPLWVLYAVIGLGIYGFLKNSKWLAYLFLAALFMSDIQAQYTRFSQAFNLTDALGLFLFLFILRSNHWRLKIPPLWRTLMLVLFISIIISFFLYKINEMTLRDIKFSMYFPLGLLIGYNWLSGKYPKLPRKIVWIFLISIAIQSVRQFVFAKTAKFDPENYGSFRTFGFVDAGLVSFSIAPLLCGFYLNSKQKLFAFLLIGIALVALILQQTRSFWLIEIAQLFFLWWLFHKKITFQKQQRMFLMAAGLGIILLTSSAVNIGGVTLFKIFSQGHSMNLTNDDGRLADIHYEGTAWLNGSLIQMLVGRGFGYYTDLYSSEVQNIFWNHNGYIDYLTTFGLIGMFISLIIIPWKYFRISRRLETLSNPDIKTFSVISILFTIYIVIQSLLSVSGIAQMSSIVPGIFLGGAAALQRNNLKNN